MQNTENLLTTAGGDPVYTIEAYGDVMELGRIQAIFRQYRRFHVSETPTYQNKLELLQYLVDVLSDQKKMNYVAVSQRNWHAILTQIERLSETD